MTVSPDFTKLRALKSEFEGYESIAYPDSGNVWTVGSGHTWNYDQNRKVQQGDTIDKVTDTRWLSIKYDSVCKEASKYIKQQLNPDQSAAIVDYIYNRGIGNFLSTQLDELINANPNDKRIAQEIMGTGLKDKLGHLLWGLGRRRYSQAWMYFTGELKTNWTRWGQPQIV